MKTLWLNKTATVTGRTVTDHYDYMPHMQNNPSNSLEDRILCLLRGGPKTFSQLEMGAGGLDPTMLASPEVFAGQLDQKLRELIACGKVRLIARKPTLIFEIGNALDRIVRELELNDQD